MRQATHRLEKQTGGPGLYDITDEVVAWVGEQEMTGGLLTLFIAHTSASLLIQENADPDVQRDLTDFLARLAPEDGPYRHRAEGPDDMPAHIKAALTQSQLAIPLVDRRLALGPWQGIYVFEHRRGRQRRRVILHLLGE